MEKLFQEAYDLLNVRLSGPQLAAMERYRLELARWNERHSLTAIQDREKVRVKHFLDSLTCLLAMRGTPVDKVVDVGTGAGFPGLPLKIVCPNMKLTLVESIGKKAAFCQHVVDLLDLEGVLVVKDRAEAIGQDPHHREQYDWALARAVANLPVLVEYLLPLVRVGGRMLAQKGESGPRESQAAERAIQLIGGHLRQITPLTLPGVTEERYLVVIDKVAAAPERYPRRVGIPAKRPL